MTIMQTQLDPATPLHISPDVIASEVDDEMMLIDINTGRYFGLDVIGSRIWSRLQSPTSIADITAGLRQQFKGDPAQIERDALAFVTTLLDRGLIRSATDA